MFFVYDAVVIGIFGNTADTVSAHGTLGTVKIIHIHLAVCDFGWLDQDQSVGTDTKVTVTDISGYCGRIFHSFLKTVYIYVIISNTMHFCKFHQKSLLIWLNIYTPLVVYEICYVIGNYSVMFL